MTIPAICALLRRRHAMADIVYIRALMPSVRHKQDSCALILRERGAQLRHSDQDLACMLCQAVLDDDMEMIKRLIDNGGDPSVCDYDNRTALHLAASEGRPHVVKYLLEQVGSLPALPFPSAIPPRIEQPPMDVYNLPAQ